MVVPQNAFVLWLQHIEKFMDMGMDIVLDMCVSCKAIICELNFLICFCKSR